MTEIFVYFGSLFALVLAGKVVLSRVRRRRREFIEALLDEEE